MKLRTIKRNMTELTIDRNTKVLFSYETPVAATILDNEGMSFYKTKEHYSATTTRHINQWFGGTEAQEVEQSFLDGLV